MNNIQLPNYQNNLQTEDSGIGLLGASTIAGGGAMLNPAAREAVVSRTLRPAAGRIMTNLVEPIGYDSPFRLVKQHGFKKSLMAVLKDQPLYAMRASNMAGGPGATTKAQAAFARELPYRRMWGLKERLPASSKMFNQTGNSTFEFNTGSKAGRNLINAALMDKWHNGHDVMGGYDANLDLKKKIFKYHDRWDLDVHPNENLLTKNNFMRWLAGKIAKPVTVQGAVPLATAATSKLPGSMLKELTEYNTPLGANPMQVEGRINPAARMRDQLPAFLKAKMKNNLPGLLSIVKKVITRGR